MKKLCIFVFAFFPFVVDAQIIVTVAGNGAAIDSGDGGAATAAAMYGSLSITFDKYGNYYIGELLRVHKVTSSGIITTIAGTGVSGFTGDGGQATSAQFKNAQGITTDAFGNLYIADLYDNRVRKVDIATGIITTIAGTGTPAFGGDGGPATSAQLRGPADLCFDKKGNLYIADAVNYRIRKIDTAGFITTIAGIGSTSYGYGGDGGPADTTSIGARSVCIDDTGNLYISDWHSRVMKIDTFGIIRTYAGNGVSAVSGEGIPATAASTAPVKITLDKFGNLYLSEYTVGNKVRKVSPGGIITTVAGTGLSGFSGDGYAAILAQLHNPAGVATDTCGNLYICDDWNRRVRKVLFYLDCPDTTLASNIHLRENDISLFPNPVNDELHISGITVAASYSINDMVGKNLLHGILKKGEHTISLKALPSGVYLVMAVGSNGDRVVRMVWKE